MLAKLFNLFGDKKPPALTNRVEPVLHAVDVGPAPVTRAPASAPMTKPPAPTNDELHKGRLPAALDLAEVQLTATPHNGPRHKSVPVPAYPTNGSAVPAASPDLLLKTQQALIDDLQFTSTLSDEDFDEYVLPVIKNYAAFVHLLPASETYHHSQVGGMFRHSLEVAYYAANRCTSEVFALTQTPLYRKEQEPRWIASAIIGGLLHDIGKAMVDIGAKDETGRIVWEPNTRSLYDWLVENKLEYYFMYWRPGKRNLRHESFTTVKVDKMIPQKTQDWLNEFGGRAAIMAMYAALNGDTSPTNQIYGIIYEADKMSVNTDIKESRERNAGIGEGGQRGTAARISRAIHDLLDTGEWILNEPGHPIWITRQGVFGIFPRFAEKIISAMYQAGDKSLPQDENIILDYLDSAGMTEAHLHMDGQNDMFWKIRLWPAEGQGSQDAPPLLDAVKFSRDDSVIPYRIVRPEPAYVEIIDDQTKQVKAGSPPPWAMANHQQPTLRDVEDAANDDTTAVEVSAPVEPVASLRDRHAEKASPRMEKLAHAQTTMTSRWPPVTAQEANEWLNNEGADGEMLLAIAERVHSQRLKMGHDVIEQDGFIHFRFPDCVDDLGIPPQEVVKQLERKGWVIREKATSARSTVSLDVGRGKPITAVRLNENISMAYKLVLPQTLADEPVSAPAPVEPRAKALQADLAQSKPKKASSQIPAVGPRTSLPPPPPAKRTVLPLGPFIDANDAARIKNTKQAQPEDGPIFRIAYFKYLQEMRAGNNVNDDSPPKHLKALVRNFVRMHPDVPEICLMKHLTARPNEVLTRDDSNANVPALDRTISINSTYDVEVDQRANGEAVA